MIEAAKSPDVDGILPVDVGLGHLDARFCARTSLRLTGFLKMQAMRFRNENSRTSLNRRECPSLSWAAAQNTQRLIQIGDDVF